MRSSINILNLEFHISKLTIVYDHYQAYYITAIDIAFSIQEKLKQLDVRGMVYSIGQNDTQTCKIILQTAVKYH